MDSVCSLSPPYKSCVMCALSCRGAVITAVSCHSPTELVLTRAPAAFISNFLSNFSHLVWLKLRASRDKNRIYFLKYSAKIVAKIQGKPWSSAMRGARGRGRLTGLEGLVCSRLDLRDAAGTCYLGCQPSVSVVKSWHMVNIPLILSRFSDLDKSSIQITKLNEFYKIKVTKLKLLPHHLEIWSIA